MFEKMPVKLKDLSKVHRALGNERRLWIMEILFNWRSKELSVGDIADKINLSLKSTSKHLQQLESAALVKKRQINTTVLYGISISDKQLYFYLKQKLFRNKG